MTILLDQYIGKGDYQSRLAILPNKYIIISINQRLAPLSVALNSALVLSLAVLSTSLLGEPHMGSPFNLSVETDAGVSYSHPALSIGVRIENFSLSFW